MRNSRNKNIVYQLHIRHFIFLIIMSLFRRRRYHYFELSQRMSFFCRISVFRRIVNFFFKRYTYNIGCNGDLLWEKFCRVYHLVEKYYEEQDIVHNCFVAAYKRYYDTDKIDNILKLSLGWDCFDFLKTVCILQRNERPGEVTLYLLNDSFAKYLVNSLGGYENRHLKIRWLRSFSIVAVIEPFYVFGKLLKRLISGNVVFRQLPKRKFKIGAELHSRGFEEGLLGNVPFINGQDFSKEDVILYLATETEPDRLASYKFFRERGGYNCIKLDEDKRIHIRLFLKLLRRYALFPLYLHIRYILSEHSILDILNANTAGMFTWECFFQFYDLDMHISINECSTSLISETIIMNEYGVLNASYLWADSSQIKYNFAHAYKSMNLYLIWGDIFVKNYQKTLKIDRIVKTGLIVKKDFARAVEKKYLILKRIKGIQKDRPIISFFDTSMEKNHMVNEQMLLDYLEEVVDFALSSGQKYNILVKPKRYHFASYDEMISSENVDTFLRIKDKMKKTNNIFILFGWDTLDVIAISNIVVSFMMNTPATVARLLGKMGLNYTYEFDNQHPLFAKYLNELVFTNFGYLAEKIGYYLAQGTKITDIVKKEDFDMFDEPRNEDGAEVFIREIKKIISEKDRVIANTS